MTQVIGVPLSVSFFKGFGVNSVVGVTIDVLRARSDTSVGKEAAAGLFHSRDDRCLSLVARK